MPRAISMLMALAATLVLAVPAAGDVPVDTDCSVPLVDGICFGEGTVAVGVEDPASRPPGSGADGAGGSGAPGGGQPDCMYAGQVIDCDAGRFGTWNGTCYVARKDPQPPKDDPVWQGHDDGVIVVCTPWMCIPGNVVVSLPDEDCVGRSEHWAPADPTPGVDAVQLAERAVDQMNLSAIEIGIVPEDEPGMIGYVGMPVWMWAGDPGPSTTGPNEASASAGGFTVTARASVDRIEWDMGNGDVVTCAGAGTPYEDRFGVRDSPDCGYRFSEQGDYTITARSFWTIAWEGVGQSGTIPMEFQRTTQIRVGELQVLTQ